ncbi:MAG: hypothetical protein CBD74_06760 [Saprospirales bacterium TMED214]|nr:MAG: hypothetical protein CBD74_06760 [Saprospirales bacterium TMED214]
MQFIDFGKICSNGLRFSPLFPATLSGTDTNMQLKLMMSHEPALCRGIAAFVFFVIQGSVCFGQTQIESENSQQNQIRIENKILGETAQRRSDMLSVSTITYNLDTRMSRVERILLSTNPYTGISTKEAKAAFKLATAKRDEFLKQPSEPSKVELAAAELSVARAESQLIITLATQREKLLLCQLDIIEAELAFLQIRKKLELQERLVARGLSTSETLAQQKLAMTAAEKKLELMRIRHETQRILQGIPNTEPESNPQEP